MFLEDFSLISKIKKESWFADTPNSLDITNWKEGDFYVI